MLADFRTDTFRRLSASYVIAADGGSSPTRGHLGIGYAGRTYAERWVVIDTKVLQEWDGPRPAAVSLQPSPPDRRLPHPAGPSPLGVPGPRRRGREGTTSPMRRCGMCCTTKASPRTRSKVLRAVVYSHHVRVADRWRVGTRLSGRGCRARDAAVDRPRMSAGVRDAANLCWKLAAVVTRPGAGCAARLLPGRTEAACRRGHPPRSTRRSADHRTQPKSLPSHSKSPVARA